MTTTADQRRAWRAEAQKYPSGMPCNGIHDRTPDARILVLLDALDAAEARALREAADDFQINTWADVVLPAFKTTGLKPLAVSQAFIDWLRARADRLGGGEGL